MISISLEAPDGSETVSMYGICVAETEDSEVLALPIYPELTSAQLEYVVEQIRAFYRA